MSLARRPQLWWRDSHAQVPAEDLPPTATRDHDLSTYSDRELRDALQELKGSLDQSDYTDLLPAVFAVVAETIGRRLGVWRLFDSSYHLKRMGRYSEMADRIGQSAPYKTHLPYYTDEGFLESEGFARSLQPLLEEFRLDPESRTIVSAMVYVAEKRKAAYLSDIGLPAEFYLAVKSKDADAELAFEPTDEQILGGSLLFEGKVVEMQAGEGKTVAAAFPAVLHALLGRFVHIITANDYLALRDTELLAPVYESLGLSVNVILSHMSEPERRHSYRSNVVYGTLKEFGFDFLRDNLKYARDEVVQGPPDVAIVDEIDHALIDEAGTPLIISGAPTGVPRSIYKVRNAVERLVAGQREVVSKLVDAARDRPQDRRSRMAPVASLYLADPENAFLRETFAADPRLARRVEALTWSAPSEDSEDPLAKGLYYTVDANASLVTLTDEGRRFVERELGPVFDTNDLELRIDQKFSDPTSTLAQRRREDVKLRRQLARAQNQMSQVYQTLRAFVLLKQDKDYVVTGGRVVSIDESNGRMRPDSRYQYGLQAAIEAKERVAVQPSTRPLAEISVQGYLRQYRLVSGMTGTAIASKDEFRHAYGLQVVAVPPSQPSRRVDLPARVYTTHTAKLAAVVEDVRSRNKVGRPVLVGTLTVEQSKEISRLLRAQGIEHRVLNAVNSDEEAQVVRSAGSFGAVTVATNMAGRGTDIPLESDLDRRITDHYVDLVNTLLRSEARSVDLDCASTELAEVIESALKPLPTTRLSLGGGRVSVLVDGGPGERVIQLEFGLGLQVIGTEMNHSKRVDDQLRGRSGRQGEFGSSIFFLSLEDRPFVRRAGSSLAIPPRVASDHRHTGPGKAADSDRRLGRIQAMSERDDETARDASREFSRITERLSLAYYETRRSVTDSRTFHDRCVEYMRDRARRLVVAHFPPPFVVDYPGQFDAMADELRLDYGVDCRNAWGLGADGLKSEIERLMVTRLDRARAALADDARFEAIEKLLFLQTSDELWSDHLTLLHEQLLSIRLCFYSIRSAVVEYVVRSIESEQRLREQVIDTFLPQLFLTVEAAETPGATGPIAVLQLKTILA